MRSATVRFDAAGVRELHDKLQSTRAASFPFLDAWKFGTGVGIMREVLDRWGTFDIAAFIARLNDIPQVDVDVERVRVRVFHLRAETEGALPIILTHGWPSSVVEPLAIAERLAHPSAFGGESGDSFHVVVPALPGFPLSDAPTTLADCTAARTADRWAGLMSALGYSRFVASAGDIGARVTAWLGARHPDRTLGIHVSANALGPVPFDAKLSAAEENYVRSRAEWEREEGGYVHAQQTKPLSLAHGLSDSPAGVAAWIVEKWHGWSEDADDLFGHFPAGELLGNLSLYWLTNSIATSMIPYYVHDRAPGARPPMRSVTIPVNFYLAPGDNGGIPPREFAERQYPVARWTELPRGGHFIGAEEPELLVDDIRAAFRPLRG